MTTTPLTFAVWLMSHLGVWLLIILVAATLGDLCLRRLRFNSVLERGVFTLALGFGLASLFWFLLGLCGLLYPRVVQAVTILIAAYGVWNWRTKLRGVGRLINLPRRLRQEAFDSPLKLFGWSSLAVLIAAYEVLLVWLALFPPLAWDSTMYHLPLAKEYLDAHGLTAYMSLPYPVLPALNHLLFSWGMALGDDLQAHLIGHSFLILTAAGLVAWGLRQKKAGMSLAAAAIWMAHPLVLLFQGTAYVDMGLSCYTFLAVYALKIFWEESDFGWWVLATTLSAMAAGTKMAGLIIFSTVAAFGVWAFLKGRLNSGELLKGWAVAALVVLPWFGFIAYHTGNPVWPMLPRLNQGWWYEWSLRVEAWGKTVGVPRTLWNFLRLPFEVVGRPDRFFPDGGLGYFAAVAAWPLAWIVSLRDRSVRWWTALALVFTTAWFFSIQALRYLFPALPMIGLSICESVEWLASRALLSRNARLALWAVVVLCVATPTFLKLHEMISVRGFFPPATAAERSDWLGKYCLSYPGVKYINSHSGDGDTAYLIGGSFLTYHLRPRVLTIDHDFAQPRVFIGKPNFVMDSTGSSFAWPQDPEWLTRLEADKPTWILFSHQGLKLPQTSPFDRPDGSSYELVYESGTAYVFRRTPLPGDMERDVVRLQLSDCPAPAEAQNNKEPVYEGYLDAANCQIIRGWVWNPELPKCPVKVDLYDNGALLMTLPANQMRDDLLAAGKGDGKHGFSYRTPNQMRDGRQHKISVKVSGSSVELSNSPSSSVCAPESR